MTMPQQPAAGFATHALPARKPPPQARMPRCRVAPRGSAAPEQTTTPDWRAFRAHLLAAARTRQPAHYHAALSPPSASAASSPTSTPSSSPSPRAPQPAPSHWVHALPAPEIGAVLLASPRHQWPPPFAHLSRAVILLTDVGPASLAGLLLSRPTRFTVGTHASVLARVGADFSSNRVWLGGDCSTGSLDVVHSHPPTECPGAAEIIPGLFRGGFNASRALVREGNADANEFRFFVAYSRWTRDAFEAEMARAAWRVVACAPSMLLDKQLQCGDALWNTLWQYVHDA